MTALFWALLLLSVALVLVVLEVFIPSGGILSFLALAAVAASLVVGFTKGGMQVGTALLAATAVLAPLVMYLVIRVWPSTPLGRKVLIPLPENEDDVLPPHEPLDDLIGRRGTARSEMLPAGLVRLDDRDYDALSEGMPIDRGQPVRVIAVRGQNLVVRPADPPSAQSEESADDILSQPIELIGLEPLDDPLA